MHTYSPTGVFIITVGRSFTIFTTVTQTGVVLYPQMGGRLYKVSRIPRRVAYITNYERMLGSLTPDCRDGSLYKDRHIYPDGCLISTTTNGHLVHLP